MIRSVVRSITRPIRSIGRGFRRALSWVLGIPKPEDPRGLEKQRKGSDQHLSVIYGERRAGPVEVHQYSTDQIQNLTGITVENRENAYLHLIMAFCHGPIEGFQEFFFNGISQHDEQWNNAYFIATRTGADNQSAIPQAVLNIPNWSNQMRGQNVAYAYVVLYQNRDQDIWRGEPEITARVRGMRVFDPRTETTGYSENPALAALDHLTNNIYGRGMDLSGIDVAAFVAAADFCDEGTGSFVNRTVCSGQPPVCTTQQVTLNEPRYKIAAILDTNQSVFDRYKELLQSFRAGPRRPHGLPSLWVETGGDPVTTFDEGELIGGISFIVAGVKDRYNRFKIRYPNRIDNFERDEFIYPQEDDPLYQQWLDEDNGKELIGELELNTIADTTCAAQSAEVAAKASRVSGRLATTLPVYARLLEPGDIIGFNSSRYGWTNKPFRLRKIQENDDGTFRAELTEHENSVYPWTGASWDEQVGGSWLGNAANPQPPTNLQLFADGTLATSGRLTWAGVNDSFVREYDIRILLGGNVIQDHRTRGTSFDIPLMDAGEYVIEVRSVTTLGRISDPASILMELAVPVPPTDLGLSASNNSVMSEPILLGAGLGTQWEFDIVLESSSSGFEPVPRLRGGSAVFTGRIPNTEYRVYVRTVNALGVSAWVSGVIRTTLNLAEQAPIVERLLQEPSITGPLTQELFERTERSKQRVADARVSIVEEATNALKVAREQRERVKAIRAEEFERKTQIISVNERVDEETEQRITQLDAIVATLDDEVEERQASILRLQESLASESETRASEIASVNARVTNESEARESDITTVTESITNESETRASQIQSVTSAIESEASQRESAIESVQQSITDESQTRALAIQQVSGRIETAESELNAQSQLIQTITMTVDGNTESISGLESSVFNVSQDVGAISDLIVSSGLNEDGDTHATAALAARIETAEDDISSNAQLILDVEQTVDGQQSAIASISANVTDIQSTQGDFAQALATFDADLDTLSARAFLGTQVQQDGAARITGVVAQDDGVQRIIELSADRTRWIRPDGTPFIIFAPDINEAIFDGRLTANSVRVGNLRQGIDLSNLAPNGYFETGDTDGWYSVSSDLAVEPAGHSSNSASQNSPFQYYIIDNNASTQSDAYTAHNTPVRPGEEIYVKFSIASGGGSASACTWQLRFSFVRADGSWISPIQIVQASTTSANWSTHEGSVTVPQGAALISTIGLRQSGGNLRGYCGGIEIRRKNAAALIVAGGIQADHLSATAIDGKIFRGVTAIYTDESATAVEIVGSGFGDEDQFINWYGPKNSTTWNSNTGYPRFDNLTYANAIFWRNKFGDYSKDVRRERNNTTGTAVSLNHLSEGGLNQITASIQLSGSRFQFVPGGDPRPSPMSGTSSITVSIFRGNTQIATRVIPIEWWWEVVASGEEQTLFVSGQGAVEVWDTQTPGNVTYRAERGQASVGIPQNQIQYQLSLQTFEVK